MKGVRRGVTTHIDVLEDRAAKVLTEGMPVLDSIGMVADAEGMYEVTT